MTNKTKGNNPEEKKDVPRHPDGRPKHPGGRPKKTLDDLPKDWKKKMLKLASEGAGDVEYRVTALGCMSESLWYRLLEEEEEFSKTYSDCRALCESWWQRHGRNLWDKDMNDRLWYRNMVNRFKWNDNQVVKSEQNINVKVDEKLENIKDRIEDLIKE